MFEFGNELRIRTYVSASGVFAESISHGEIRDSLGIVQLSGKPGEKPGGKWNHGQASMRDLEDRRSWESLFSFCQPGSSDGEGDSNGAALWLIDGYDVLVNDIYSCDRP